jgi:hypothetical protein
MSEETIQNPHDQLFMETFSHVENAVGFFQSYLPADLRDRLDWDTLALQPGKYTDEALRGSESDLLYTVQIDQHPALLYCLFEHQSTPDAWMPLRLLRYVVLIWEQFRKQNPAAAKLPPVLPLVLFQGGATWTADLSLSGLIDIPDGLAQYQPEFRHLLVDLNHINSGNVKVNGILKEVLLALKIRGEYSPAHFADYLRKNDKWHIIKAMLRYTFMVDAGITFDYLHSTVLATNCIKIEEEIMTIAEQLRSEGRQEGYQEGRQAGRQEEAAKTLLKILDKRFGSVSQEAKEKINVATSSQLGVWIDASLDAVSVEQVFSG